MAPEAKGFTISSVLLSHSTGNKDQGVSGTSLPVFTTATVNFLVDVSDVFQCIFSFRGLGKRGGVRGGDPGGGRF